MKTTKHSLLMSAISLLLSASMLIGTTFAWFTDSVTSSNNKIQSGTLKVDLELLGTDNTTWTSLKADKKPIFNYLNWEPGYTDVKILKIENEGTLALKWMAKFVSTYQLSELANVIDVYVCPSATEISYPANRNLDGYEKVGTVADFVNDIEETTKGTLTPMGTEGSVAYLGIALKMQEEANNDYQNLDLGGAFDIQILATQYTYEKDSFNDQYDANAMYDDDAPLAKVTILDDNAIIKNSEGISVLGKDLTISTDGKLGWGINLGNAVSLDTAYQFEPSLSLSEAEASEYADWHADFVVYANKDIPKYALALAGYYDAWCSFNDDAWVALASDQVITAGTEIRLVEMLGASVSYTELSEYGNDGIGFLCGAVEMDDAMLDAAGIDETTQGVEDGTVLTVELRLYEATGGGLNTETGDYVVVGKYDYKF